MFAQLQEKPSRRLPPALAKLEALSPSYGGIAQLTSPVSGSPQRISPKLQASPVVVESERHQGRARKHRRKSRHCKALADGPPEPPRQARRKLAPLDKSNFDEVFAAAKKAVSQKQMAERWRPQAVLERVEVKRKETDASSAWQKSVLAAPTRRPRGESPAARPLPEGDRTFSNDIASVGQERVSRPPSIAAEAELTPSGTEKQLQSTAVLAASEDVKQPTVDEANSMSFEALKNRFQRYWDEVEDPSGFDKREALELFNVFMRARYEGDRELDKDELPMVTELLGHLHVDRASVRRVADGITPCSTLSFEQFLMFMRSYSEFEQNWWQEQFDKYDADYSGQICLEELKKLLEDLGYTPFRSTLQEALAEVDVDQSGQISLKEFQVLIVQYRETEGFTRQELSLFAELFQRFDRGKNGELDPTEQSFFYKYLGMNRFDLGAGTNATGVHQLPIVWRGFLAVLRRCRELEVKAFRREFAKFDDDGSGELTIKELPKVFEALGWMPLKNCLRECIAEVDEDGSGALDFEEFVHMIWLYRQREGFTSYEMEQLTNLFNRFDVDDSGEISVIELGDLLRHEGYTPDLTGLQRLTPEFDIDGNGDIALREFLKIMRRYRENELAQFRHLFDQFDSDKSGSIATQELGKVFQKLGLQVSMEIVTKAVAEVDLDASGQLDWDEFVELMEKYRMMRVLESRKRCGFSNAQVKKFLDTFHKYDSDHSGDIDGEELIKLLGDFNMAPRSQDERDRVMALLDRCRSMAEESDGKNTFWAFLRLMRTLEDDKDRGSLAVEKKAAEKAGFSKAEVDEFREVFLHWYEQLLKLGDGTNSCGAEVGEIALTTEGISRILRSLDVHPHLPHHHEKLAKIVCECDDNGNGVVDFPDFLLVMRRLLDENFCNIKKAIGLSNEKDAN